MRVSRGDRGGKDWATAANWMRCDGVVKSPKGFLFRNPGLMRIPPERALRGGESDCRNSTLHKLFLLIGLGERAGSGLPKILHGWPGQISLSDSMDPYNQTFLELRWPVSTDRRPAGAKRRSPQESSQESPQESSQESSQDPSARILEAVRKEPNITAKRLAERLGISMRAVQKQMASLRRKGRLDRVGPTKGGHWRVLP